MGDADGTDVTAITQDAAERDQAQAESKAATLI